MSGIIGLSAATLGAVVLLFVPSDDRLIGATANETAFVKALPALEKVAGEHLKKKFPTFDACTTVKTELTKSEHQAIYIAAANLAYYNGVHAMQIFTGLERAQAIRLTGCTFRISVAGEFWGVMFDPEMKFAVWRDLD